MSKSPDLRLNDPILLLASIPVSINWPQVPMRSSMH